MGDAGFPSLRIVSKYVDRPKGVQPTTYLPTYLARYIYLIRYRR